MRRLATAHQTSDRGRVNYRASPRSNQLRNPVFAAEVDPLQVHCQDRVPRLLFQLDDPVIQPRVPDSRVVIQDVQAAVGLHGKLYPALHLGCFGHIQGDKRCLSALCSHQSHGFFAPFYRHIGDHNLRAFFSKQACCRPALSTTCSRNQRYFPCEPFGHSLALLCFSRL